MQHRTPTGLSLVVLAIFVAAPVVSAACGGSTTNDLFQGSGGGAFDGGGNTGDDGATTQDDGGAITGDGGVVRRDGGTQDGGNPPPPVDGGAKDTGTTAADPGILCGTSGSSDVNCNVSTQYCCATQPVQGGGIVWDCHSKSVSACAGLMIPCDDRADCGGGTMACCGVFEQNQGYTSVTCKQASQCQGGAGGGGSYVRFCDPNATVDECAGSGGSCQPSQSLPGYSVCK